MQRAVDRAMRRHLGHGVRADTALSGFLREQWGTVGAALRAGPSSNRIAILRRAAYTAGVLGVQGVMLTMQSECPDDAEFLELLRRRMHRHRIVVRRRRERELRDLSTFYRTLATNGVYVALLAHWHQGVPGMRVRRLRRLVRHCVHIGSVETAVFASHRILYTLLSLLTNHATMPHRPVHRALADAALTLPWRPVDAAAYTVPVHVFPSTTKSAHGRMAYTLLHLIQRASDGTEYIAPVAALPSRVRRAFHRRCHQPLCVSNRLSAACTPRHTLSLHIGDTTVRVVMVPRSAAEACFGSVFSGPHWVRHVQVECGQRHLPWAIGEPVVGWSLDLGPLDMSGLLGGQASAVAARCTSTTDNGWRLHAPEDSDFALVCPPGQPPLGPLVVRRHGAGEPAPPLPGLGDPVTPNLPRSAADLLPLFPPGIDPAAIQTHLDAAHAAAPPCLYVDLLFFDVRPGPWRRLSPETMERLSAVYRLLDMGLLFANP